VHVEAILAQKELKLPPWNPVFNNMPLLSDSGPWRRLDISVSPISLNLVDADILAKAIGKWYANGLVRVKKRTGRRDNEDGVETQQSLNKASEQALESDNAPVVQVGAGVGILSLHIERLELALEGHSKREEPISDDRSVNTFTSDATNLDPRKRTYAVQLLGIHFGRVAQHSITRNNFLVSDVKIVRIKDEHKFDPLAPKYEVEDLQHCILIRRDKEEQSAVQASNEKSFDDTVSSRPSIVENTAGFLSVSLFHDRSIHLDEVEIDMNSVVLRITPTTLKDCTKGLKKILELVQLVTREMERKVHEEGRKARLGRHGK
jgi:hypothetical protein